MAATAELTKCDVQGLCQRYWSEQNKAKHESIKETKTPLRVLSYELRPTSEAPAGFLGQHQFLSVQIAVVDDENNEHLEELHFFAKSAPIEIESRMQYLNEFGVFQKEILTYREILPNLQNIIPGVAAKCYFADNNLLVFENLAAQGYRMAAGRDGILDYEHLNCTLKTLAAMHASSIIYEVRQGQSINDLYGSILAENAYPSQVSEQHGRVMNYKRVVEVLKEIIRNMPKYKAKLNLILDELPKRMSIIFELCKVSKKYKNVFTHGDLWANNVMFQYTKDSDVPQQSRFVDFQLARYAPPMLDLVTILTIPTTRRFRAQYLEELLSNYYHFLADFLKAEGLDIADYITRDQFDAGNKEFMICGLIESCLFSHITVLPPELTRNLLGSTTGFEDFFFENRVEICMKAFNSDKVYRDRLQDMIEDLIDNYILA